MPAADPDTRSAPSLNNATAGRLTDAIASLEATLREPIVPIYGDDGEIVEARREAPAA